MRPILISLGESSGVRGMQGSCADCISRFRRAAQAKLARGSILDVAVNIRRGSRDYGPAGPYCEDDEVNPLGIYSNSKPAGGRPVCEAVATHMILRTAWIYDARGQKPRQGDIAASG
jgi:hypothetical protein